VQNADRANADMTVSIEVKPEIRGEIDSVKLARLLRVLQEVSLTFSRAEEPETASPSKKGYYKHIMKEMMHEPEKEANAPLSSPPEAGCWHVNGFPCRVVINCSG
jgi:hypothetical protein